MIHVKGPLRNNSWAFLLHVVLPLAVFGLVTAFTSTFFFYMTPANEHSGDNFFCAPNGKVILPWDWSTRTDQDPLQTFTPHHASLTWDPKLFLSITLAFGKMSFSAAKALDFIWDYVVGRGGTLLLVMVTYPIVRRSLTLGMERGTTSLAVFTSLSTETVSFTSFWRILCSAAAADQGMIRLTAMAFTCTYVLAFGDFMALTTGYKARLVPYFRDPISKDLVPTSELTLPDLVVFDGHRIGLSDGFPLNYYRDGRALTPVSADGFIGGGSSHTVHFANGSKEDVENLVLPAGIPASYYDDGQAMTSMAQCLYRGNIACIVHADLSTQTTTSPRSSAGSIG